MAQQFQYLFSPLKLGPVTVRNRIVNHAHLSVMNEKNMPTERYAYYLADRAKGGVGLIIQEFTPVHPSSLCSPEFIAGYDERTIPGLKLIANMVHGHGAKIGVQLAHMGRQTFSSAFTRLPMWAPSPLPSPPVREIPHAMTVDEIQEVEESFVKSASNFQEAGYDGIEIHCAHGYLICEFMSPFTNHRTDAYGGSIENRLRFPLEIIDAVRGQIGNNMMLGIRISGDEMVPGGLTLDDMREITARLEETGKLDYISVSLGINESGFLVIGEMSVPLGAAVYLAAGIKEVVNLPVFTVLRINDPVQAEQILAEGKADMIGMVRALICDPELPNKARAGLVDDIRKCMACNEGCGTVPHRVPICCTQNPTVGFERELGIGTIKPAATKKKVVVVGGGPGGLEAGRILTLRGHQVTLYEKARELGGQVNIAGKVPSRNELGECTRYLRRQIEKLGVDVRLGVETTADNILQEKPDVVVVATGSTPLMRDVPGAAEGGIKVTNVREVMEERVDCGDNTVVFDFPQGFRQCLDTAEFLARKGKKVTIVTPMFFVGHGVNADGLHFAYQRLLADNVTFIPNCNIRSISNKTLIIYNVRDNKEQHLENTDSLVLSLGGRANDALYHELRGKVNEVYSVGDCVAPRTITEAIREGHLIGRQI